MLYTQDEKIKTNMHVFQQQQARFSLIDNSVMYFFRTTSRRSVKKIRNHVNSVKKLQALRSPNLPKLTTRSRNYPEGVPTSSHETFKSPAFYARALARG